MKVSDRQARLWIESMVGWTGPDDAEVPNSPVARAFLAGTLGEGHIPTFASFDTSTMRTNQGVRKFLSFIEGVAATMRDAGVRGIEEDV